MIEIFIYSIGYFYSIVIGHFMLSLLNTQIHNSVQKDPDMKEYVNIEVIKFNKRWIRHPQMIGILERALFTTAILHGKVEFIAFWIILKSVGRWKIWYNTNSPGKSWSRGLHGRLVFNIFLISTGFSVAYGFIGAKIIKWVDSCDILNTVLQPTMVAILLLVFTFLYYVWDKRKWDLSVTRN